MEINGSIAKNRSTPKEILEQLLNDEDVDVAHSAAKRLRRVNELVKRISKSESEDDMILLAMLTDSKEILRELCHSNNFDIVDSAVANPYCPIDEVYKLSDSDCESVRHSVAAKNGVSVALLRKLSDDGSEYVRRAVADNSNTPTDILEKLSYDAKTEVRKSVAKNLNTSDDTLYRMFIGDKDVNVMYYAGKNIKTYWRYDLSKETKGRFYYKQLWGYLENENVSDEDLRLAFLDHQYSSYVWNIIASIAENRVTSDETFDRIFKECTFYKSNDSYTVKTAIKNILKHPNFEQLDDFIDMFF